jgi:hypothetical protein
LGNSRFQASTSLAKQADKCGQRLGAARKAGSFEGTLPRPFSFALARTENWKSASFKPASPYPNLPDLTQLPRKRLPK